MNRSSPTACRLPPVSAGSAAWRGGTVKGMVALGLLLFGLIARAEPSGNFFQSDSRLPADLQRVLILPLTAQAARADLESGCESLAQVLQAELAKTRRFEVVHATAETLRSRTGRSAWSAADALPAKFFSALREAYGCDAVLFCEVTAFKAYAPLSVGWRLRLVDARSQQTLWASDEVFDASHGDIQHGARRYERQEARATSERPSSDWLVLNSPRRFGQFTLATLLATLPRR